MLAVLLFARVMWVDSRPAPVARAEVTFVPADTIVPGHRRLLVYAGPMGPVLRGRPIFQQLASDPEMRGTDLLFFHPKIMRLTFGPPDAFATRLRSEIDAQWIRAGGYDDVILSGASVGSVIARHAFVASAGSYPGQPRTVPWADSVTRIVLITGIGRGIGIEQEGAWKWPLRIGRYVPVIRRSIVYDQLRGAESISAMRIAWIRHFAQLVSTSRKDSTRRLPTIVQVLGSQDDYVRREDNIDFQQFPNAFHLVVPGARHGNIFYSSSDSIVRFAVFREAFLGARPGEASPYRVADDSIRRVVMLLHGIRSNRYDWVKELATQLRQRVPNVEVIESSYGNTSVLGFMLPGTRRRNRLWLQDQYTEALARHPNATVDVVAHSNGAYLLGESLAALPVMRFDRVALLGSVLPSSYPWRERHALGQVGTIRSERAAGDAVVAVVANGLRGLGMTDVGTSGWNGFNETGPFLVEPGLRDGGHHATVSRENLSAVADFIATGRAEAAATSTQPGMSQLGAQRSTGLRWLSAIAPWTLVLSAATLAVILVSWVRGASAARRWSRLGTVSVVVLCLAVLLDVL